MLTTILYPALVVSPYVGFTLRSDMPADYVDMIAEVIDAGPEKLTLRVLNGDQTLEIDQNGTTVAQPNGLAGGKPCFIQWQGKGPEYATDYGDLIDHAEKQIKEDRTGPLHGASLTSCFELRKLPIAEVAQRLSAVGDGRLERFLRCEYPQICSGFEEAY